MPVNPLRMIFLSLDQNHHLSILTCDLIFYARRFLYNDAGWPSDVGEFFKSSYQEIKVVPI